MRIFCENIENRSESERRLAFRAVLFGTQARVKGLPECWPVNDLSVSGLSLAIPDGLLQPEQELRIDLLIAGKVYLADLQARVVRSKNNECACSFGELTRHQELKLDKLILEMQKRYIARQKQQTQQEQAKPDQPEAGTTAASTANLRIKLDDLPFD